VCPPGFSSYRGYGNLLVERIHVRILGHAGRILRSYLHDLCDHGIQACYRGGRGLRIKYLSRALFGCLSTRNDRVAFLNFSHESLSMGVERRVYYLVFATDDEVDLYSYIESDIFIFIGCVKPALPMGLAPEAIVEFLFEYRLSIFFVFNLAVQPFHIVQLISTPIFLLI
jgi:hypothetical protein